MMSPAADALAEPFASQAGGVASISKSLAVLEIVAERGGASAREVSAALGYPLPTVYRLMQTLVHSDYLVHRRRERRFDLGPKLHQLGVSLHRQTGVPQEVRLEVGDLHQALAAAAYFAVYRGSDVVVIYLVDSPAAPRPQTLGFGRHTATHTAFGRLRGASSPDSPNSAAGAEVAWQRNPSGTMCAAVAVHGPDGSLFGALAVSAGADDLTDRRDDVERMLRAAASRLTGRFRAD